MNNEIIRADTMIHPDALDKQTELRNWVTELIQQAEDAGLSREEIEQALTDAEERTA